MAIKATELNKQKSIEKSKREFMNGGD